MAKLPNPRPRGSVITATRVAQGMTRRTLAEQAGIKYVTVYNLETGFNPRTTRETINRIAAVLGVEADTLVEPEEVAA